MKKESKLTWIMIALTIMLIPTATAELCSNEILINNDCNMITPPLNCGSYDYTITDQTNTIVQSGTMELWDVTLNEYNFTITQPAGKYIITLCDGTMRLVEVKEDETTMIAEILIIIATIIMIYVFMFYKKTPQTKLLGSLLITITGVVVVYLFNSSSSNIFVICGTLIVVIGIISMIKQVIAITKT